MSRQAIRFEFEGHFEGAEGDFELVVVGLLGGDTLEGEAGSDENFYEGVFDVAGTPFQNFIGDTTDEWEPCEAKCEVGDEGVLFWEEHVGEDGDDENNEDETRATSWVEAGLFACVLDGEIMAFFVGPNRFVLGAVVLEDAVHLF